MFLDFLDWIFETLSSLNISFLTSILVLVFLCTRTCFCNIDWFLADTSAAEAFFENCIWMSRSFCELCTETMFIWLLFAGRRCLDKDTSFRRSDGFLCWRFAAFGAVLLWWKRAVPWSSADPRECLIEPRFSSGVGLEIEFCWYGFWSNRRPWDYVMLDLILWFMVDVMYLFCNLF